MTAKEGRLESLPHDQTFVRKAEQTLFYSLKKQNKKKQPIRAMMEHKCSIDNANWSTSNTRTHK